MCYQTTKVASRDNNLDINYSKYITSYERNNIKKNKK